MKIFNRLSAMLQSIVTTCPSMQNGSSSSPPPSQPPSSSSTCPSGSTCDICRICHCEAENDAPLIGPCVCAGSLRYVHQACLQQWIKSSNTKKCELCKFEFIMHTKIKPLRQWERLQMTSMERRRIFCSVTFHVVAITCVVWSLYVLIDRTAEEVKAGVLEWPFWTKLIVVAIGFSGGLVFMYVQCKMYLHLCQRWKAFNRIIYVQNAPPKSASTAVLSSQASSTESTSKVDSTADPCVVTMVTETLTMTTTAAATTVLQSAPAPSPPPPPSPSVEVRELQTAEDNDHEGESAISGSEVTMVEPIDRVT